MTLPFSAPVAILVSLAGGYLLGSTPFGVLTTRMAGVGDLRQVGSGSTGATNVLRTGRRDLALITLVGDAGKGALAALLAGWLFSPTAAAVAAGAAFVGHLFPVWVGFRGGKGVATFFGVLLTVVWPAGLAAAAVWIAVAAVFRRSSLAGLTAAALSPVFVFIADHGWTIRVALAVGMAVLIFVRHHQNIARLVAGTEPRIGATKTP